MSELLGIVGGVIALGAATYYVVDIVRGATRPQRVSWGVWSLIAALGFDTAVSGGAGSGAYVAGVNLLLAVTTFGLSLKSKYGKPDREPYDPVLGAVAVLGILSWRFFGLPINAAASLAVGAEYVAAWPTLRASWRRPDTEPPGVWAVSTVASTLAVVAAAGATVSFAALAYPVALAVLDLAVTAILVARRPRSPHAV